MQGLQNAVESLLPYAEHRNCATHIHANWKKKGHSTMMLKNMFWKAVKCTTPHEFEWIMRQMEAMKSQAAHDFQAVGVQNFYRAFISMQTTSPTNDNNVCESFKNYILQSRSMPIIDMLEYIRSAIMHRIVRKRNKISDSSDELCPNFRQRVSRWENFHRETKRGRRTWERGIRGEQEKGREGEKRK